MTQQQSMTIAQALELATQQHRAGNVAQAESIYRQIIVAQPNHADALHQFGVLLFHSNRLPEAIEILRRAVGANPTAPRFFCNLGAALAAAGQAQAAMAAYRDAIALRPDFAEAFYNLGNLLRKLGQTDDAITAYRQALAIAPQTADAWINLGNLLREKRDIQEAISAHRRAVALQPNLAEAHHNLGNALLDSDQIPEAIAEYRLALSLKPELPGGHSDLANAFRRNGDPEQSLAEARQAISMHPDDPESFNAQGNSLLDLGQKQQAIEAYRHAISLSPNYALAHANLSLALLLTGDFEQGWTEHEWRLRAPELGKFVETFSQPMWDGGELNGRTILLHAEQAFGDAIQFARYAELVAQRGGKVILKCPRELVSLMKTLKGPAEVIGRGETMPLFDVHCPLMSLPRIFGTRIDTIPSMIPYLRADPQLSSRWRERLAGDTKKIGLVWAGRRSYRNDRNRSMAVEMLAPLAKAAEATYISLQKGWTQLPFAMLDWTGELNDFADTAALIDSLDLVIAVDTAVAHLAGALGKRVWILLPFVPDWRWMLGRADSPWYPTARLFRQPARGDWATPIEQIVQELARWPQ